MTALTRLLPALLLAAALPACDMIIRREDGTRAVEGRYQHSATWTGKEMIVGGGNGGGGGGGSECENAACDFWELYDPASNSWRSTYHKLSRGRNGHSAVWTGSELLVWGGQVNRPGSSSSEITDSGLRFNPSTNVWSSISGKGAPKPRTSHTAVWTGSEMIVWGGAADTQWMTSHTDGGRYDPKTDTWKPLSATGAPTARSQHGAVWTGKEMIVWGGQASGGGGATAGARYDPATDAWSPAATAGQPDTRQLPGLIWTGKEMIVFGGQPTSGPTFTLAAGSYDPQADSWRALAAPKAVAQSGGMQWYPAAVWIGDGLVSWRRSTGGERYRAATDTWESLTPKGESVVAPSADLDGMTAVWTGSEVIVWGGGPSGGASGDTPLPRTGLRFNPVTNTWRPTAVVMPDWD